MIPNTVHLLFVVCCGFASVAWAIDHPAITQNQLRDICPQDESFCAAKAVRGGCFGKRIIAQTLRNKCECTCDVALSERIQACCDTVGDQGMRFCLPLCRYNTTVDELTSGLGFKCVSQLTTWAYCASDTADNTDCCLSKGVPTECLSFCKGDVPTCDLQSIFSYQPCLKHLDGITACQKDNLEHKPRWDRNWSARCAWDGKK